MAISVRRRLGPVLGVMVGTGAMVGMGAGAATAQSPANPFAGRPAGGSGPYGSETGARIHLMQGFPAAGPRAGAAGVAATASATDESSAEASHSPESRGASSIFEAMFVGCSAGAFLGGYSAWSAAPATVAAAELTLTAAPGGALAVGAIGVAAGIGCGLGAATGVVSLSAASVWSWVTQ